MGLREILTRDSRLFRWDRALLLALALQVRNFLLLLGVWLSQSTSGFPPFISRLRVMPAHPDWYLAALIQSLAIGLVLAWLVRRLAVGWAVPLAAVAGALASLTASRYLASSNVEVFARVLRSVLETVDTLLLLGSLAALLAFMRSSWGMVLASTTAALLCGATRLCLTYSVWGTPWAGPWRFDLAVDAVSGAACGLTLLLLPASEALGPQVPRLRSVGLYLGPHGLSVLSLAYLQLALRFAGWRVTDSPPLLWTIGGLTVLGYVASFSVARALRPNLRLFRGWVALELCAAVLTVCALGPEHWLLSLTAVLGLIVLRAVGALAVAHAGPIAQGAVTSAAART